MKKSTEERLTVQLRIDKKLLSILDKACSDKGLDRSSYVRMKLIEVFKSEGIK